MLDVFFALTSILSASLDQSQDNQVKTLVEQAMTRGLKGAGVAVVKGGKQVFLSGFSKDSSINSGSHFRLASISKQFTSGIIVKLVREKKLSYDTTLGALLPETPKTWHPVTVRQLLTHTSGIPSYTDLPTFPILMLKPTTPAGIWKSAAKAKIDFEPGKGFQYNNTGYCLLGSIIEKLTKKPYFTALTDYILRPVGMNSTGAELQYKPVDSYDSKGVKTGKFEMTWAYSAGSIVSTLGDMVKWDIALRGNALFSEEEKSLMFNPDSVAKKYGSNYGFGWETNFVEGKPWSYSHTGGIPGFSTVIERTIKGTTVILLLNHESVERAGLSNGIMEIFEPAPKVQPVSDDSPELTLKHKEFFQKLLKGEGDESDFAPEFLQKVSLSVITKGCVELAANGPLSEFTLKSTKKADSVLRAYRVTMGGFKGTLSIAVKSGKIVGMTIQQ